jgi:hypothetical protein
MAILDTEWLTTLRSTVPRMTPWDEVLRRHEHEREMIMRWEERADETETVHQFASGASESVSEAASSSGEQSEHSRATSRATSPDFYIDR